MAKQDIIITPSPTVASVSSTAGTYTTGNPVLITVTFSEAVTVDTTGGTPTLALNSGGSAFASYTSGSGGSTLTFTYTVGAADSTSALDYTSTGALALNGGTIVDTAAPTTNADLTLPATGTDGLATLGIVIN